MIVYILHDNRYYVLRLPKDIAGTYALNDFDTYGSSRTLSNVFAEDGKWYINATSNYKIFSHDQSVEKVVLKPYTFYNTVYNGTENILIYIDDGYDKSFSIKSVSDGTNLTIGSNSNCDIVVSNPIFCDKQFQLSYNNSIWELINQSSTNSIYINSKRRERCFLFNSDFLFVMGLKIVVCANSIFIGGYPGLITKISSKLTEPKLSYALNNIKSDSITYLDFFDDKDYFYKSPVFRKKSNRMKITISSPENQNDASDASLFMTMVPTFLMSISSLVSTYFTISNYKKGQGTKEGLITSLLMCAILLFTSVVWPFVEKFVNSLRNMINEQRRVSTYKKYLKRKRQVLLSFVNEQKSIIDFNNLSLVECKNAIIGRTANLFSRNIEQENFLDVKDGTGKCLLDCDISYSKPDLIVNKDKLLNLIDKLVDEFKYVNDVPINISLKNNITFVNKNADFDYYMQSLVLQLVSLHDYESLKIVVFTTPGSNLYKIKNLNHCWDNERENRFFASNIHEAEILSSYLLRIFNNRITSNTENNKNNFPFYLIISDNLFYYRNLKIIEQTLQKGSSVSFATLLFASNVSDVPNGCHNFISYDDNMATYFQSEMEESNISTFVPELINDSINFDYCMQLVSNIPLKIVSNSSGSLPTKLGFLEMFKVGKVSQLNSINRWKSDSIINSLAAPLGVDVKGDLIELDLHEKAHGPHGLIAGMTGSGKSETIITYILSMAVTYSPDEVQFVLIDYKGGGLAGAFENRKTGMKLPHLVGTITNLDSSSMSRTLVSIKSELQRRQRIFNDAKEKLNTGTIDIYKYQKLVRDGSLKENLAHLFIICDEFAELKQQQPDFMDELVSAARIGRSLGVHLILATQKPSGVVDDQIWSNSRFKICCKVQTAEDSNEMLRKPDAAYIKESGRFYLQVGYDEIYVKGQSGYTGTKYVPSDIIKTDVDNSIDFVKNLGGVYKSVYKEEEKTNQDIDLGEELGNVIDYLIKCANEVGYKNQQLWLDSIPNTIYLDQLQKKYSVTLEKNIICSLIGEYDDPANQKQGPVLIDFTHNGNLFVCGLVGSGKTTLMSTMIYSIIVAHTSEEVNLYILDFGVGTLKVFQSAPQVVQFLTSSNRSDVEKLFYYLEYEINRRKNFFSNNGSSFVSSAESKSLPFPNLLIFINSFEVFKENFNDLYDDKFSQLTRECSRMGIYFVVTSVNAIVPYVISDNFLQRIALHFSDINAYTDVFGIRPTCVPLDTPGRGLVQLDKIYEMQVPLVFDSDLFEQNLNYVIQQLNKLIKPAIGIPRMPRVVTIDSVKNDIDLLENVPIGLSTRSNCPLYYNFDTFITPILYESEKSALLFENSLINVLVIIKNVKVIVLNVLEGMNNVNGAQIYNNNYKNLVIALYNNIIKKKNSEMSDKIVIFISGYTKLQNYLVGIQKQDSNVKTIDDLIDLAKDSEKFRFIISDNKELENVDNTSWAEYFDYCNGILIGLSGSDQYLLDVDSDYSNVRITRDVGVAVVESQQNYIKYIQTK